QLGAVLPRRTIVTLDVNFDGSRFPDASVITTDGAYFLEELKRHIRMRTSCLLPDEQFDGLSALDGLLTAQHLALANFAPMKEYPMVVYALSYQDGLSHSLRRILNRRGSGEYSHRCDVQSMIQSYENMQKTAIRRRRYWDAAYIEGYVNGMYYLLLDQADRSL